MTVPWPNSAFTCTFSPTKFSTTKQRTTTRHNFDPYSTPRHTLIVALRASLAFLALFCTPAQSQSHAAKNYASTIGLRQDLYHRQLTAGLAAQLTHHVDTELAFDFGPGRFATQIQPAVTVHLGPNSQLGFLASPELLSLSEHPTIQQRVQYLNGATGIFLHGNSGDRLSAYLLAERIFTDSDTPNYYIAATITI